MPAQILPKPFQRASRSLALVLVLRLRQILAKHKFCLSGLLRWILQLNILRDLLNLIPQLLNLIPLKEYSHSRKKHARQIISKQKASRTSKDQIPRPPASVRIPSLSRIVLKGTVP